MTCNAIALYVAVCHSLKYAHVTLRKTVLLLVLTWMWNTGLSCLHFIQKGFYTADTVTVSVTYDTTTWWFGCVLLLNAIVLPVTTSSFCYYRIRIYCTTLSQSMSTGSGFGRSLRMMALARMNLACFVFFILSWIFIHLAQALKLPQGWTALATLTVYTYHALKIGLYLYLYAPFRNTARSLLRCRQSDHRVSDTFEMDTTERNTPSTNTSNTSCDVKGMLL
ncbi:uncharacterized protein [Haliotis cracherodii]|uniref:uncharacterized protein n=1 Tax=Haliotis cracherodii TaxID=6455 RepID=UPI0039ED6595